MWPEILQTRLLWIDWDVGDDAPFPRFRAGFCVGVGWERLISTRKACSSMPPECLQYVLSHLKSQNPKASDSDLMLFNFMGSVHTDRDSLFKRQFDSIMSTRTSVSSAKP